MKPKSKEFDGGKHWSKGIPTFKSIIDTII